MRWAAKQLADASATARLDAEVLLRHVGGFSAADLIARANEVLDKKIFTDFAAVIARRKQGEPIAYLTGVKDFWSLPLRITTDVLIPRPETELLVEKALEIIPPNVNWRVADLGTGSGAIAIAIAKERPLCKLIATDNSQSALHLAEENAKRHDLNNIEFRCGDWFAPLKQERFDIIVCNPPYVPNSDPHLNQGDVRFEPKQALAAGEDGLDAIRIIVNKADVFLKQQGWLMFEHGYNQHKSVKELLQTAGLIKVETFRDIADQYRLTIGQRSADL